MAPYQRSRTRLLSLVIVVCALSPAVLPVGAAPAQPADVLSGRWAVSRSCQTVCVSPAPVVKTVRHMRGRVYMTDGKPRQVLLQLGMQVLVYDPTDSLLLTIDPRGRLMTGSGVGADGSTFTTTWRCVTPRRLTAAPGETSLAGVAAAGPGHAPSAMEAC